MSIHARDDRPVRTSEAGFTLVEAMIAIVILVFGLMAIANLFTVAASSNSVANQGTAATAMASQQIEQLRATSFDTIAAGGNVGPAVNCASLATYERCDDVPGVGRITTQWQITQINPNLYFIRVRSEGTGAMSRARSRAEFTTFRACSATGGGCP